MSSNSNFREIRKLFGTLRSAGALQISVGFPGNYKFLLTFPPCLQRCPKNIFYINSSLNLPTMFLPRYKSHHCGENLCVYNQVVAPPEETFRYKRRSHHTPRFLPQVRPQKLPPAMRPPLHPVVSSSGALMEVP